MPIIKSSISDTIFYFKSSARHRPVSWCTAGPDVFQQINLCKIMSLVMSWAREACDTPVWSGVMTVARAQSELWPGCQSGWALLTGETGCGEKRWNYHNCVVRYFYTQWQTLAVMPCGRTQAGWQYCQPSNLAGGSWVGGGLTSVRTGIEPVSLLFYSLRISSGAAQSK